MENLAKNPYSQSAPMDNELKIHRRRYLQVSDAIPNPAVRGYTRILSGVCFEQANMMTHWNFMNKMSYDGPSGLIRKGLFLSAWALPTLPGYSDCFCRLPSHPTWINFRGAGHTWG